MTTQKLIAPDPAAEYHENLRHIHERALQLDPTDADAYHRLGRLLLDEERWALAAEIFQAGLHVRADRADLHLGLGEALFHLGSLQPALAAVRAALSLAARDPDACRLLIATYERLGRHDDAVAAWSWLGEALERSDQFDAAAAAYRMALAWKPDALRALVGLGRACMELARPREAIAPLEKAIALAPFHARAHQCLGWAHAHAGNLQRNWEEIAWYDRHAGPWQRFEQPAWDGSPLDGKTILLWSNAALGDTIQMVRFARYAKARGGRVIMECFPPLLSLFADMPCVDEAIPNPTPLPAFHVHALLASLPGLLGMGWDDIPDDVPYLDVTPASRDEWRQRLGPSSDLTVGLVWGSAPSHADTRFKSAPLAAFAPLANMRGVRFVSLQLGPQADELTAPPAGLRVSTLLDDSCVVADTAALILNLDLVITIDTMVAHLAGALGRPVWTLLHHAADWRWRLEGHRSPWYPTMRLFRQPRPGHWRDVLEEVRGALEVEASRYGEMSLGIDASRHVDA